MKKVFPAFLAVMMLIGLVGGVVSIIQFVMALRYGELGRVVVYFTIGVLSTELFLLSLTRLVRERKRNQEQS